MAPWNYPLTMAVSDALAALMAGNGAVIKPDTQTPYSCLWAVALLEEAGLPHRLVRVVTGRGAQLGEPIISAADYLMFTGSTATGRTVAGHSAAQLKDCSMELGGKNAMLVLPDADLRRAVAGAVRGITSSSGQLCISIERLYVHDAVYDVFTERLAEALRAVRLGASLTFRDDMGSLISAGPLAKVAGPVDDARAALYLYQLHRKTWEAALKRPGGMRELRPPMNDRKRQKKGGNGSGGAQAALAKLAEEDEMVDL